MMKVQCPDGQIRQVTRNPATGELSCTINKKKVLVGHGPGNMIRGFRLVPEPAPKQAK